MEKFELQLYPNIMCSNVSSWNEVKYVLLPSPKGLMKTNLMQKH